MIVLPVLAVLFQSGCATRLSPAPVVDRSSGRSAEPVEPGYYRIKRGDKQSYTVRLAKEGVTRCAQKVGEEGVETALAALGSNQKEFTGEAADLLYHLIVLLRVKKLSLDTAVAVLAKRHAPKK